MKPPSSQAIDKESICILGIPFDANRIKGNIIGGDIVEYNPDRDFGSVTAMVAAKLLKELIGRIYTNQASKPIFKKI